MIGRAAYVLTPSVNESTLSGRNMLSRLVTAFQEILVWPKLDRESGMGISHLLQYENSGSAAKGVLAALTSSSPINEKTQDNTNGVDAWLEGVAEIIEGLFAMGLKETVHNTFRLATTPEEYLLLMAGVAKVVKSELWSCFIPGQSPQVIIAHLNTLANTGQLAGHHESAIEAMLGTQCEWP